MSDDELIGYAWIHSRSDRALFHRDHVNRLLVLAGHLAKENLPEFVAVHYDEMKPILDACGKNRS